MFIKIRAIRIEFRSKEKDDIIKTLSEFNRRTSVGPRRERIREDGIVWPEMVDGNLDRMGYDLTGYRYDRDNELLAIYTTFEYRLYVPCGEAEYLQFVEDVDTSMAHNIPVNCLMVAYYSDPDFTTFRSLNPGMRLFMRWIFH